MKIEFKSSFNNISSLKKKTGNKNFKSNQKLFNDMSTNGQKLYKLLKKINK